MRTVAENIKHHTDTFLIALDQLESVSQSDDPSMRSFWLAKAASIGSILAGLAVVEAWRSKEKNDG